ncbi:hypothetical protein B2J88_50955 [Rhodococcus sp. SRB_17]|nr:hypothetical protein [Rhodococcus sp. SRB_17]
MAVVGLLPLLWWSLTLLAGALGVWYEVAGDVIVTWNLLGAVGLMLVVPGGIISLIGSGKLGSSSTFRRGRTLAAVGLALVMSFCLLAISGSIQEYLAPPARRDPNSWSPVLSSGEQLLVVVPYAIMLAVMVSVVVGLWRRSSLQKNEFGG